MVRLVTMLKRWQKEVEKDVLPACSVSENCFHVLASDDHVILASSRSSKVSVLKDGKLVRVAELQGCVHSIVRALLVGPAGEDCFFIICATSTGGIWVIPERQLLQQCQDGLDGRKRWRSSSPPHGLSGKRCRTDGSLSSQQAALGVASADGAPADGDRRHGKQEPAEDNAEVFASLLRGKSTATSPRSVSLAELSSFWDTAEGDVQSRVVAKYCVATVRGSAALAVASSHLTVISLPAASQMAFDTFQLDAADPARSEAATLRRIHHVSRPKHSPGAVTRALLISRSADSQGSPVMAGSFIDYATSPHFATTCLLLALDDGCVYCQSPDDKSPTQEKPLLRCRAPLLNILPVSVSGHQAADGLNGIVAVDQSGYIVLFAVMTSHGHAAVSGQKVLKPMTRFGSVAGPVSDCCLLQCPSGNGTELVSVLVCAGDAGVTFALVPHLARFTNAAEEPFELRTVPLANVCCVWPAGPGVCMCRGRFGSVTRVDCPSFSPSSASPHPVGSGLRFSTMQDALSELQAVSEAIERLQTADRHHDQALLCISQNLHIFKGVHEAAGHPQSAPAPLRIAVSPVLGGDGLGVDAAHLHCTVQNFTELVLSGVHSLQVSIVYSSPACRHSTSWSIAVPLAHLTAGGTRHFQVPLLPQHIACCTVSLTAYLVLDIGKLLASFPPSVTLLPAECDSCVELVHSEHLDILSFCKSHATANPALALDWQRQPLLPLQMMSNMADSHRCDVSRPSRTLALPGKDEQASKLHELSMYVPLSAAVVVEVLCDLLGVAVTAGQRYALALSWLSKCWIELKQAQPRQSCADGATCPGDRCTACNGEMVSACDLQCVMLWSGDRNLLPSLHRALLLRFQARAEQDRCHALSCLSPGRLRARVEDLGSQVQSLRDQFIDLQSLIRDTAHNRRSPAAGGGLGRPVSEQLARFREGMWKAYSSLLSVPVSLCTL